MEGNKTVPLHQHGLHHVGHIPEERQRRKGRDPSACVRRIMRLLCARFLGTPEVRP